METVRERPYVICYLAISLDGRLDGFDVDLERYYGIAARFEADAILSGSETAIVALEKYSGVENVCDEGPAPARAPFDDGRPLFAVVNGRGRVRRWSVFQQAPYWRGWIALLAGSVPEAHVNTCPRGTWTRWWSAESASTSPSRSTCSVATTASAGFASTRAGG